MLIKRLGESRPAPEKARLDRREDSVHERSTGQMIASTTSPDGEIDAAPALSTTTHPTAGAISIAYGIVKDSLDCLCTPAMPMCAKHAVYQVAHQLVVRTRREGSTHE